MLDDARSPLYISCFFKIEVSYGVWRVRPVVHRPGRRLVRSLVGLRDQGRPPPPERTSFTSARLDPPGASALALPLSDAARTILAHSRATTGESLLQCYDGSVAP